MVQVTVTALTCHQCVRVNLQNIPQPFEAAISLPSEIFEI
jgi:hypothetical protein